MTATLASRRRAQSDCLENRFHLTHSEACLVLHLVEGISLKSSAEKLGVTYETVRSYLKSAFLKTGTHRQAELVLKVFYILSDPNGGTEESRPSGTVADAPVTSVIS